ncbi:flagellar hook-associated protein FlgK [uncultured Roseovarius sp.]|uniref:flagellar hook-associated protein FlgK n=1 Tax=uncultured Roseovarius sp. TaxID=293344 RepID=UPI00263851A4|nr:flagellar hook-associated protein FlgK [uncultured Roseovarius sp.]
MSISGALSNAVSGLNASALAAGVVSSNLANVLTPGYGPRALELASQSTGAQGGVSIVGISRHVDQGILSDRRSADSELAYAGTRATFIEQLERIVGTPDETSSLSARVAAFDASLISAASRPEATEWLQAAVQRASELADTLNAISSEIQTRRTAADSDIAQAVETVNTTLERIRTLNVQIARTADGGNTMAALQDQRQLAIDQLSEFVPVQQIPRDNGAVALFTPGGAILLDSTAAELDFTSSNVVAPHMTLGSGLVSGLTINGINVTPSGNNSPISGGKLSALFEIRDDLGVDANTQVDALARDLIERFQAAGLDATRAPGDPGLFTDAGVVFDPLNEVGIAGRIAVNTAVDPDNGGELWRLRDGLGAVAPGPAGNSALLQQLQQTLNQNGTLNSGNLGAAARSLSGHAASFASRIGQDRLTLDQDISFAATRQNELLSLELAGGVDSDAEMQRLLLIEQSYSANARMIQTIDEMMQALLRI